MVPKIACSLSQTGLGGEITKLTEGTIVRPPKDSSKDHPSLIVALVLGVAAIKVPNVSTDVIRARSVTTGIVSVSAQPKKQDDLVVNVDDTG